MKDGFFSLIMKKESVGKKSSYGSILFPQGATVSIGPLGFIPKSVGFTVGQYTTTGYPSSGYLYTNFTGVYSIYGGVTFCAIATTRYNVSIMQYQDVSINNALGSNNFSVIGDSFSLILPQNNTGNGVTMYWFAAE